MWTKRLCSADINPNQYVAIAEIGDKFCGFVCVFLDKKNSWSLIDNLHVSPEFRLHGTATYLMHATACWILDKAPIPAVYLLAYSTNVRAFRFYEGIGGIKTTEEPFEVESVDGGNTTSYDYFWASPTDFLNGIKLIKLTLRMPFNIIAWKN